MSAGPLLERIGSDGATVLQPSVAVGAGPARSLRWANTATTIIRDGYIRVRSAQCTTECGPDDTYRLRSYDTSYTIPRFGNAGGQVTAVIIFNPGSTTVSGQVYFWNSSASLLHTDTFNLAAKQSYVLLTSNVAALTNMSGAITVTSNGGYAQLTGKATTTEQSTGFAFDSLMVVRPR